MEKINGFFHNLSFRKSFVLYVCIALFAAYLASGFTASYCRQTVFLMQLNSTDATEGNMILEGQDGISVQDFPENSPQDKQKTELLNIIEFWCTPVYVGIAVIAAALLFYRNKMKRPLAVLMYASERISENDLDFTVIYESKDEFGKLSAAFEQMRLALAENNRLLWQQMERRKRLNAAFAHDLRTPLTVLKGYLEMMQQTYGNQTIQMLPEMMRQADRLERYTMSMSKLQQLEDSEPDYRAAEMKALANGVKQMAEFVCADAGKEIDFQSKLENETALLDEDAVLQVAENLVSNAARYADKRITVQIKEKTGKLFFRVEDDGTGFTKDALQYAAEPYYSAGEDRAIHFGLGLYISKLLCEQHGGTLRLYNHENGAGVQAFFRIKWLK